MTRIEEVSSIYYSVNTNKKYINALENDLVHVFGKNCLNARINDLKLVFTPKSFFQLNTRQAEVLYDEAVSLIDENDEEVSILWSRGYVTYGRKKGETPNWS